MITHELISSEWNSDYPKYEDISGNISELEKITLKIEGEYFNKYQDFHNLALRELYNLENKLEKLEKVLKLYYSKKPLSDDIIEEYNLEALQITFTKPEVDMMVRSDERVLELKSQIKIKQSVVERIKNCIKFTVDWRWNLKNFVDLYKMKNGII